MSPMLRLCALVFTFSLAVTLAACGWADNATNHALPILPGGSGYTVAVKNNGTLWAWGQNTYGQLGHGTFISRNIPVQIGTW